MENTTDLPAYDDAVRLLHEAGVPTGAAEVHGIITGVLCAPEGARVAWEGLVLGRDAANPPTALSQLLAGEPGTPDGGPPVPGAGPLTGGNFADWADRLRTVESLLEDDQLRERLSEARAQAEEQRREWQRAGKAPQWDLVETGIIRPLEEARVWLKQELARLEDPEILQPIDRDPVPEKYAESVRKYYEALSVAESARSTASDNR